MGHLDSEEELPWYRFFWPWFLVMLLGTSVVGGISSVVIAFRNQDSLVRDDYYSDGQAINRRLESEQRARDLSIGAGLRIDDISGEVNLNLHEGGAPIPDHLDLELSHATSADRDVRVRLLRSPAGGFRGQLDFRLEGRYYASISSWASEGRSWRLQTTVRLPSESILRLGKSP
jgi:hypothetical protein